MRRLWLRLCCAFGIHAWHWVTLGDPEEVECRRCTACGIWQAREFAGPGHFGEVAKLGWQPWEPYEPTPEPWGPVA